MQQRAARALNAVLALALVALASAPYASSSLTVAAALGSNDSLQRGVRDVTPCAHTHLLHDMF